MNITSNLFKLKINSNIKHYPYILKKTVFVRSVLQYDIHQIPDKKINKMLADVKPLATTGTKI